MQQIKIFKDVETNLSGLEKEVNDWLARNKTYRVINVIGNMSPQSRSAKQGATGLTSSEFPPSDVLLVVVYEKS